MQERKSLDSTVTDLCSQTTHGSCFRTTNEVAFIKKQLLEIDAKQSNLLDLLEIFNSGSIEFKYSIMLGYMIVPQTIIYSRVMLRLHEVYNMGAPFHFNYHKKYFFSCDDVEKYVATP